MGFIDTIKKSTLEMINQLQLCDVVIGTVVSTAPLIIDVDQRYVLTSEFLILARNVTEHTIEMTVDHETELENEHFHSVTDTFTGGGTSSPTSHLHKYKGRKMWIVHKGLIAGEKVIMLKAAGGQKYYIIDRIGV